MREQREIVDKFFCQHRIGFEVLMKMASKMDKWKGDRTLGKIKAAFGKKNAVSVLDENAKPAGKSSE